MKRIVNIRIENNKPTLFKFETEEIVTYTELYLKIMLSNESYEILHNGGFSALTLDDEGNKIIFPDLKELEPINVL